MGLAAEFPWPHGIINVGKGLQDRIFQPFLEPSQDSRVPSPGIHLENLGHALASLCL